MTNAINSTNNPLHAMKPKNNGILIYNAYYNYYSNLYNNYMEGTTSINSLPNELSKSNNVVLNIKEKQPEKHVTFNTLLLLPTQVRSVVMCVHCQDLNAHQLVEEGNPLSLHNFHRNLLVRLYLV